MKLSGLRRITLAATGLALASGAFLGGIKTANATPSTLGFYPSTDIYSKGTIHFDADSYARTNLNQYVTTSAGLTYGLGPEREGFLGRTEFGVDYLTNTNGDIDVEDRAFANIKTQLFSNATTRVVVGGWGLGDTSSQPNYLYLLGSKTFGFGRVHLGVSRGLSKGIFRAANTDGSGHRTSLQLGYDRYITPKLQFAVDYYSGKGFESGVQPTLYYYINEKADFGLGYFRLNDDDQAAKDQIYLCFDYNFDFMGKKSEVVAPAPVPETAPGGTAKN